jgi:hypothetical protein
MLRKLLFSAYCRTPAYNYLIILIQTVVFSVETPRILEGGNGHFEGIYSLYLQG